MFHCESDLLANLIVLSPKLARKRFRESIFHDWDWQCAYCDKQLSDRDATLDHVVPKHKGGHNTRNNLVCSCSGCNRAKGSQNVFEYLNPEHRFYSEQRVGKIKTWLEQKPCSVKITSTHQTVDYASAEKLYGWAAT